METQTLYQTGAQDQDAQKHKTINHVLDLVARGLSCQDDADLLRKYIAGLERRVRVYELGDDDAKD